MSVRLDPEEAWEFVGSSHTGILTTLRADGAPISLPVWFVALERRIYVSGPGHAMRHRRIRRDPRVAFLVESGHHWRELKAVHVTGRASIVTDRDLLTRVASEFETKYAGHRTPRSEMPAATRSHYDTERVTIEIAPDDRVLSWDNAKIDGSRLPGGDEGD